MKNQRYVLLTIAVGAILAGMVAQSAVVSLLLYFAWPDSRVLGLFSLSALVGVVSGLGTFLGLLRSQRSIRFTDEVIGELAKVTWPSREETIRATTTVVFTTLFVALLLGLYDLVWKNVADLVLFTEG